MSNNLACFPEDAVRLCQLSGANVAIQTERMLTLQECEKILINAIREGENARIWHGVWRGSELVARSLVVIADTVVAAVGVAAGPAGILVSKSYGGARLVVDSFSGNIDTKTGAMAIADNKLTIAGLATKGKVSQGIGIAGAILTSISSAYDQITGGAANVGGGKGIDSAVSTAKLQLLKIQRQIADLRLELENC